MPVSSGESGGPSASELTQQRTERAGREPCAVGGCGLDVVEVPPAQLVEALRAELLPAQRRRRIEPLAGLDQVVAIALAIPLTVEVGDDVLAIPDVRAHDGIVQPDFLDQLTMQRLEVGFARVETTTGKRPHRRIRELEPDEQDVLVGCDEQRANGLPDAEFGHRSDVSQSFGVSRRPSLKALYIP